MKKKRFMNLPLLLIGLFLVFAISCEKDLFLGPSGTFVDTRDSKEYEWVRIGDKIWMAENLAYLPSVVGPGTGSNTTAYYYVYGYDGTNVTDAKATSNYDTYGVLYNWTAAMDGEASGTAYPIGIQGVCPTGWRLPNDREWKRLEYELGMCLEDCDDTGFRGFEGSKLAGNADLWHDGALKNDGDFGTSGFTALPGGYRSESNFMFLGIGYDGYWWTESDRDYHDAWMRKVSYICNGVNRYYLPKELGLSVRCLRDTI